MLDYIRWIRSKVGHDKIFLNFAGGCVVNEKGEILLQKRGDKKAWGFPGGALELGESAEEAAIREIEEETGLSVQVDELIGIYTKYNDEYPNGDKAQTILFFFKCSIKGGELVVDQKETLELKFIRPEHAPALVNQQHEDGLKDYLSGQKSVIR
ncbi:NUDIX domain-containing protein [Chengkuizengella axinellae]|uniref:NUDIX domain-containing protein n=1 Tax=Chengkuizengella axinellae TaxID=3064388 RepID=A0ABT9IWD8_9BACL|nr:NUDIX domain-containing protein [Chengkuizengella sp. 2205SS18-9]MDP5273650.1 NUDIX domain-containing protein [Chengkuizengella sp. 2205SS18-9]